MSGRWTVGFRDRLFGAATLALLAASLVSGQRGDGPQSRGDQKEKSMALAMPSISSPFVGTPVAFAVTEPLTELTDQASMPEAIPNPIVGFDGLSQQDNAAIIGSQLYPPDTDGQAGPNHFVQAVNLLMRVFSKTGTPLTAPVKISSLFAPLGGLCAANDDGSPIVLHDQLADRWLITQPVYAATPHQCIAISTTGDPTGSYFLYDYVLPGTSVDIYPKFGLWPDAYYMANLQFNQAGTAYLGQGAFAFDRSKMLEGNPNASFIYFNLNAHFGMLPSDMDGLTAPPPGTPNYFAKMGTTTSMRLFGFQANFANPSASTFTELTGSPVTVAAYDPVNPTGRADIEQPSPATTNMYLDSLQDRLMYRLAYRNFVSHESLVVTHTVNVGLAPTTVAGHRAAVRYYEFRRSLPGGSFTVPEQATFGPDTDNRWMGSAAMDSQGNIAVGYSVSSTTTFPSIRYAGRLASDPPNGLFQGEASLIAGSGVQRGTANRWGEQSALTLDPTDDCTFWYTTEYYTAASQAFSTVGWLTRIGTFKFPSCTPAPAGTIAGVVRNAGTNAPIANAMVTLNPGGFSAATDANGAYSRQVPPGTYTATATASQSFYGPASATVVVTNGGTTTQDFFLSGIANLLYQSSSPSALDTAFCSNLSVTLLNNGAASATGISATLSSAVPGVVIEQATSAYANIAPGSTGVNSTPFKVRFSSGFACAVNVSFTLTITTSAGVVSLPFTIGTIGTTAATTSTQFDNNTPLAIPDSSTVESTMPVSGLTAALHTVTVSFHLTHTFTGDLVVSLIGPDNTTVELTSNNGGGGDNYGTGCSPQTSRTTFDAAASTLVTGGSAPFVGTFRPEGSLATFSGKSGSAVNGTWKLRITDSAALDVGTLQCWSLMITPAVCTKGGSCAPPTTSGDFDVDGRSDIAVFRPSTGQWLTLHSGTNYSTSSAASWGLSTDVTVAGDYDGDAKTDFAVFRASVSSTRWFIRQSSTNYTTFVSVAWGTAGDIPVPGDYDADGRTDPAVYRPSTRQWFILQSSTNYATSVVRMWGLSTDIAAPADYDGDGKTDLAVYRPSTGQWFILKSSTGFGTSFVLQFGNASDIPVQGDYDGDRKADVAVYRGSTGQWFILRSSTNYMTATTIQWGLVGDAPVPADYDGDDRLDLAVFRPSNGTWHLLSSGSNYTTFTIHNFGIAGDTPVLHRP